MARRAAGARTPASLLAATAVPPWPARDGYSLRAGRLLEELASRWPVTVLSPPPEEAGGGKPGAGPAAVDWRPVEGVPATNMLPWREARDRLTRAARSVLSEEDVRGAVLWNGTEYLAREIDGFPPAVADRIDCGAMQAWRNRGHGGNGGSLRERLREIRRGLELLVYEGRVLRSLAGVVATGPDDAAALERLTGHERVPVVPNGVELPALADLPGEDAEPTVVFTGVLAYPPNVEAARWFAREAWPAVRDAVPEARFVIAGRSPAPEVSALGREDGIEVRPDVPDMNREIRRAAVAVAPMRSGSGIKNKVLEAWAVGRPVVLTELATNGLGLDRDGELAELVCTGAGEMAEAVADLLRDGERRRRLGELSREVARKRHSWESAGASLARALEEAGVVDSGAPAPADEGDAGRRAPPVGPAGSDRR